MRSIRLTTKQLRKLSDILSDLGLVSIASIVLPATLDKADIQRVVLGLIAAFFWWAVSLKLIK